MEFSRQRQAPRDIGVPAAMPSLPQSSASSRDQAVRSRSFVFITSRNCCDCTGLSSSV
jgi:hypothetical protein